MNGPYYTWKGYKHESKKKQHYNLSTPFRKINYPHFVSRPFGVFPVKNVYNNC